MEAKTSKINYEKTILTQQFLNKYKDVTPPWGFSGLGEIVYKRTYSRLKADDANEEWYETVARCINGAQEIGAMYTVEEAERLYDHVFNLRCNFAGRMLWQLGTGNWKRYGANAYLNCWFRLMNTPESFCFLFENSMLGGGVGYSVRREDVFELPRIHENVKITHTNTKDAGFIVPDSREGWINLLRKVMRSYFTNGKSFSYSTILVRSYGEKINGFGGTASGPGILVDGITNICKVMEGRAGKKLRSIDVLDICNIIGSIVVAGNVRRCLPEYSLVHCKDGLKQIKDVTVGEEVLTITGYQKVLNKFVQGKQDTVFVYTQDGVLECTKNHKIAVLNSVNSYEWVEAGKLKSGDRIISSRTNIDGIDTVLPNWTYVKSEKSTTCQDIIIPSLDADMSWFLGVFQADGYTYPNYSENGFNAYVSLVFGENEYMIAEKAKKQLERFGLTNVTLEHRKNEKSWMVKCTSKQIAWYLDKNIKQANTELVIPGFILRAKQDIKLAFVCGVFDGDGSNGRPLQLVSTVYLSYAQALQKLLYSCGLETRISETQDISRLLKGWRKIYRLNVITANTRKALIDCRHSVKTIELNEKSQRCNGFPSEWIKENKRKFGLYTNKQLNIDSYDSAFQKSNICPVEVIEVTNGNIGVETYDIEVATNEFFADGYLVHNSAQIALGDPDDYLFIRAKRWDLFQVPNWRALSNNTIYADDYTHISNDIWEGYAGNGEPYGLFNVKLSRKMGRLGELKKDNCDGTNPCAEISLADAESCNLCELYINNITSKEQLIDCSKLLYKTQKAICALPFLHEETNKIVHKNMRIGQGITGICQSIDKLTWLDEAYKALKKFDIEWSKKRGWNESIKLTTVKPSGTLSLLAGSTPGVHPAFSRYYIRRVRIASDDKLVDICKKAGYHVEYSAGFDGSVDHKTSIVSFPCYAGENAILAKDMKATDQLNLVKRMQTEWADNAVSVTVYYKKEELPEIKEWLKKNYKDSVKSVSFLLHSEHGFKQAPYEEITEAQYKELSAKIKRVKSINSGDNLIEDCSGGACPIK